MGPATLLLVTVFTDDGLPDVIFPDDDLPDDDLPDDGLPVLFALAARLRLAADAFWGCLLFFLFILLILSRRYP